MKEALLYGKKEDKKVLCNLCNHRCLIPDGGFGICAVRENKGGVLYTHSYGRLAAANIDPIEKKPIFHIQPGSTSYSIASIGCNFRCGFCQNWQISQKREADKLRIDTLAMAPGDIIKEAKRARCGSISYTYTEPTIFFEYALETARLAKEKGLLNIFVTNGYMTAECLDSCKGILDAANVDLKSFSEESYKNVCGARLRPVLDTIERMKQLNVWVEVTTLVVPGVNDSEAELSAIASFLANISRDIPWHISRFYPQYHMNALSPTPSAILKKAYAIGRAAGLRYVYLGNVPGEGESTLCYNCNELLVDRVGFTVKKNTIKEEICPNCKTVIAGIWKRG